jgi:hypothetical protein
MKRETVMWSVLGLGTASYLVAAGLAMSAIFPLVADGLAALFVLCVCAAWIIQP